MCTTNITGATKTKATAITSTALAMHLTTDSFIQPYIYSFIHAFLPAAYTKLYVFKFVCVCMYMCKYVSVFMYNDASLQ